MTDELWEVECSNSAVCTVKALEDNFEAASAWIALHREETGHESYLLRCKFGRKAELYRAFLNGEP